MAPIILVSSDVRIADGYSWHAVPETYLHAVAEGAGAIPLGLPALETDLEALLGRVDGVVLTGARSNVHPSAYGTPETEGHGPFDRRRDVADFRLINAALGRDLPLFCICRGMQELNVALGGTLANDIQTLPERADHRARPSESQDERYGLAHEIAITPAGALAKIVGADRIEVNSLHRQAIDRLAEGLAVEARAEDGTIEAVSVPGKRFVLGVQWHPEYWFASDPPSAALFRAFGEAARQ
ncbi:MAG TPA: gamma-glutamyl-gamma-aminobutyrate hydrolase family protein [Devosia sp.]